MEEHFITLSIYEHTDRHGRFIAFEIDVAGRRPTYLPPTANRRRATQRECVYRAMRAVDPTPDTWERVPA